MNIGDLSDEKKEQYWNSFYASARRSPPSVPSQFAAFTANEVSGATAIIEFGCGNGRDSEFFGLSGFSVLALDASNEAVQVCRETSRHDTVEYRCAQASTSAEILQEFAAKNPQLCVYGRFFLHAISPEEQEGLLQALENTLPSGTFLAFEYRTTKDAQGEKAFGMHYRRFLDHNAFVAEMECRGYKVLYEIEGRGLAKYKSEDAFVGRLILQRH